MQFWKALCRLQFQPKRIDSQGLEPIFPILHKYKLGVGRGTPFLPKNGQWSEIDSAIFEDGALGGSRG
ncbi:MAG: hypothetical protein HY043_22730 [Verrucomicrobia bacterium]|nr:hypothetical protein [Verrucomicrobiota bacterium]